LFYPHWHQRASVVHKLTFNQYPRLNSTQPAETKQSTKSRRHVHVALLDTIFALLGRAPVVVISFQTTDNEVLLETFTAMLRARDLCKIPPVEIEQMIRRMAHEHEKVAAELRALLGETK
jgi:hypothetical protein